MASLFAVNMTGGEVLYLTPCDNWINNAKNNGGGKPGRYAAYFFNNSPKAEAWVAMTQVEGEFYQVTAPSGNFTNVIFCSMNPGSIGLSWNDKWNQTGDLSYDGTKNHYTVKAGTWGDRGSWSTYTPPIPDPVITITAAPEFATTTVGETSSATLKYTLENATEATATIEGEGFSISAQTVGSVTIAFAPDAEGDYTGTLTITSGEVKETVALAAKAVAAEAPKVPEFLNVTTPVFAEIIEGEVTTAEVTYKLVNATEATASVDGEFFSIIEQELGKVIIEFASEEAGVFEGTLTLTSGETVKEITFTATAKKAPVVITISFVNPDWDEVALYAWTTGDGDLTATWPGLAMTKGENNKFTYDLAIPEDGVYKFIINDNGNGSQSVDMLGVTESTCYNLGAKSDGKYSLVVSENCDYTPAPEPEPIDPYVAIRGTMTDWTMGNDIKMTYNAEAANGPEWYITAFEVPEEGKFKVVSVDAQSQTTWYGSDKVDLQEGITNDGKGDGDIVIPAGKYDIYFKVNEGRMWIQKYVEPEPEPEPVVITFVDEVTFPKTFVGETTNDIIEFTLENAAEDAEVVVEVTGEAFSVAEVKDNIIYLAFAPEAEGEYAGVLTVTVGEVSESLEFTAVASPEEPKPSLTVSTEEVVFEEVELGDEPVVLTETITYKVDNSEDTPVVELESEVFTAEDVEGTITITFAPTSEGEYTAELTITLGEIVKKVAISGSAKAAEIVEPEEPRINIIVSDFERNTAEVGDETDAAIVYSLENIESAEVEIEGEYVTFEQTDVEEGFMIAVFFRPEEVGEFPGKLTITAGEISEEIEFTFIATEPEPEIISIKVAAPENWESCYLWAWEIGGKDLFDVFPGVSMPKGEDGFYVMNLEISGPIGFLVSNGSGIQTEAYIDVDENTCFNVVSVEGNLILEVNEDCQYVAPEIPKVTFNVRVPSGTEVCYIAGTPLWSPIEMEKVEGEENMFTITTDLLNGQAWKYCAGPNFDYAELTADGGVVMDRTDYGDPDVVEAWARIYDPDFEPIDPYYAIRGLNGDASWTGAGDIVLEFDEDGNQYVAKGFTVTTGESFKVIYIDENAKVSGYYAGLEEGCNVGQTYDDKGNIILPAGKYDLYFKPGTELMWISVVADTPTDAEEAAAELIYAVDGTIFAPAPFAIIDLSGKDVTNANGSLQGTYIVKTQNSTAKISVK